MKKKYGKLCIYGCFKDSELYPRNRVLIRTLSDFFDESVEIRPTKRSDQNTLETPSSIFRKIFSFFGSSLKTLISLLKNQREISNVDLYFVPYPSYLDIFILRLFTSRRKRRIAIDSFLCLHDTIVRDRKILKPNGIAARAIHLLEKNVLQKADLVFIDTEQQKSLLVEDYKLKANKIIATPLGIDEYTWTELPTLPLTHQFEVLFWGTFIPLHGVDIIVDAARILVDRNRNITIKLIGDGQTAEDIAQKIKKKPIETLVWRRELVDAKTLRSQAEQAHCILGIFGTSKKAGSVIPYKAYQAMASNKILITRKGSAFQHHFCEAEDVPGLRFVPAGSAESLAVEIERVYQNYNELGANPRTALAYNTKLSNKLIHKKVENALNSCGF